MPFEVFGIMSGKAVFGGNVDNRPLAGLLAQRAGRRKGLQRCLVFLITVLTKRQPYCDIRQRLALAGISFNVRSKMESFQTY